MPCMSTPPHVHASDDGAVHTVGADRSIDRRPDVRRAVHTVALVTSRARALTDEYELRGWAFDITLGDQTNTVACTFCVKRSASTTQGPSAVLLTPRGLVPLSLVNPALSDAHCCGPAHMAGSGRAVVVGLGVGVCGAIFAAAVYPIWIAQQRQVVSHQSQSAKSSMWKEMKRA
jgi:hypothetical protein